MKHGFIRVAAATPDVKVADPQFNRTEICALIRAGIERKAKLMVFPELSLTAYTCGDLFGQDALLSGARRELKEILKETEGSDLLAFIGMPWERGGKLYNAESWAWCRRRIFLIMRNSTSAVISSRAMRFR